jgi:site-specific recombinase XerD
MKLDAVLDSYVGFLWESHYPETTTRGYIADIRHFVAYLNGQGVLSVDRVTARFVHQYIEYLQSDGYALRTVSHKINAIKVFFRYLFDQGLINDNFTTDIQHPKQDDKPPRILSPEELAKLREVVAEDILYKAIVETLLQTGMKIGEAAKLQLEHLVLPGGQALGEVMIYDRKKSRKVPINVVLKETLLRYIKERPQTESQSVFIAKNSQPISERNIRRTLQEYFKIAGITNIMVNDLRNSFIAHQLVKGVSVGRVAYLVGFTNIISIGKYIKALGENYKPELEERIETL